jgi:DNA helicase TIP49 (TBP-interacting protein)
VLVKLLESAHQHATDNKRDEIDVQDLEYVKTKFLQNAEKIKLSDA